MVECLPLDALVGESLPQAQGILHGDGHRALGAEARSDCLVVVDAAHHRHLSAVVRRRSRVQFEGNTVLDASAEGGFVDPIVNEVLRCVFEVLRYSGAVGLTLDKFGSGCSALHSEPVLPVVG